jgi:hypothetical protein
MSPPVTEKMPRDNEGDSDNTTEVDAERGVGTKGNGSSEKDADGAQDTKSEDPYLVRLDMTEDPKTRYSSARKWLATLVIGSASLCTTCALSIHSFVERGMQMSFGVLHEVTVLGISLFVEGLGISPSIVGPLSELYSRNPAYWV